MAKRKSKKTLAKIEKLKADILYYLYSPVRIFKTVCFWVGFTVTSFALALFAAALTFYMNLPSDKDINFATAKQIAMKKIRERSDKKFSWTPLKDINRNYLYSIVLSEDVNFFKHDGISYDDLYNAFVANLKSNKRSFGASTISQQVSKNIFLNADKTYARKIKEYFITKKLEANLSKNQILELYLNLIEVGPGMYGVREASRHYFNKKPSEINPAEGSFIAIMLPSPRRYHFSIYENQNFSTSHRKKLRRILKDMVFLDYISESQYQKYRRWNFFKSSYAH